MMDSSGFLILLRLWILLHWKTVSILVLVEKSITVLHYAKTVLVELKMSV